MPAVGKPGEAEAEYAIFDPFPVEAVPNGESGNVPNGESHVSGQVSNGAVGQSNADTNHVGKTIDKSVVKGSLASFSFSALDWKSLPTLHHIASTLAEIPVYGVIESKVEKIDGVPSLETIHRIE